MNSWEDCAATSQARIQTPDRGFVGVRETREEEIRKKNEAEMENRTER